MCTIEYNVAMREKKIVEKKLFMLTLCSPFTFLSSQIKTIVPTFWFICAFL